MPQALDISHHLWPKINVNSRKEGDSFLTKQLPKASCALQPQSRIEVESQTKGSPPSLDIRLWGKSCSLEGFLRKKTFTWKATCVLFFLSVLASCLPSSVDTNSFQVETASALQFSALTYKNLDSLLPQCFCAVLTWTAAFKNRYIFLERSAYFNE